MKLIVTMLLAMLATVLACCGQKKQHLLLSKEFVKLGGDEGLTIIKNLTQDTVNLSGNLYSYLPYTEDSFSMSIPPDGTDTLEFNFAYPDFIVFHSHDFCIFNGPGRVVKCHVVNLSGRSPGLRFEGDFAGINEYYLQYYNHLGGYAAENKPYYAVGDRLRDFNRFPQLADSINAISLFFLHNYKGVLPDWFKGHESWRLRYNASFRKYNVLFSKEFYDGKKIMTDERYYDFEKRVPLHNQEMVLNTDYLSYVMFFTYKFSKKVNKKITEDAMIHVLDSLLPASETGDVLKLKRLFDIYRQSRKAFDAAKRTTTFTDQRYHHLLDSLIQAKLGLPKSGASVPDIGLEDVQGNKVSLSHYRNNFIILNFWASWCGPCIREFPHENRVHQKYKDQKLLVVNICVQTDKDKWKDVSEKNDLKMINLFSDPGQHEHLLRLFELSSLPRSILLDPGNEGY